MAIPYSRRVIVQVGIQVCSSACSVRNRGTLDAQGYKSVGYSKLIPLLIEAIKAQQIQIESQQAQIEALKGSPKE
jgi:hypothetical protein